MNNPIADKLRSLPQFSRIRKEDAQRWVSYVHEHQPRKLLWLLDRLGGGFGGTESGPLILEAMGRKAPFRSATELVNEKLMRVLPSPSNRHMRKGIALEEAATRAVLRLYGGERDTPTLEAFKQPHPNDPFGMAGNPDLPWNRADGVRTLVDIKVPGSGEETLSNADKTFLYCSQLNHYNILNEARGLTPFDQLMNINLELPPVITDAMMERLAKNGEADLDAVVEEMVNLLKYDRPGMRLHMVEHPINPDIDFNGHKRPLKDLIQEVCAINWQITLDGNVPEVEARADAQLSDEQKAELARLEAEHVDLRALRETVNQRLSDCMSNIDALCADINHPGKLSQTDHANIKRKPVVDMDTALHLCQRYGIDTDSLRADRAKLGERDYDTLAMVEALKAKEVDLTPFVKPAPIDAQKLTDALQDAGEDPARVVRYETEVTNSRKKVTNELLAKRTEYFEPAIAAALEQLNTQTLDQNSQSDTERPAAVKTTLAQ